MALHNVRLEPDASTPRFTVKMSGSTSQFQELPAPEFASDVKWQILFKSFLSRILCWI